MVFVALNVNSRRAAGASSDERQPSVNRRCAALARAVRSLRSKAHPAPVLVPWLFGRLSASRCLLAPAHSSHGSAHIAPPAWLCRSRPSAALSAAKKASAAAADPSSRLKLLAGRAVSARLRWGGAGVSAAKAGIIGSPILASLIRAEAGLLQVGSGVIREIDAP